MNLYDVKVEGFPASLYSAASRSAAVYRAFLDYREPYPDLTFRDFIRRTRARKHAGYPSPDGYDSVRRQYGVDPTIGQRVRLNESEGQSAGRAGVVVYPGPSTCYVHVLLNGMKHPVVVHPMGVDLLPAGGAA